MYFMTAIVIYLVIISYDGCIGFNDETFGALVQFGHDEIGIDALNQEIFELTNIICRQVKLLGQFGVGDGKQR